MTAPPRRRVLRLRPLAFTVFAMITVLGAVALAFYLVNLSAEDVYLDRERNDAVADRQMLTEGYGAEGLTRLVRRIELRERFAAPEAHYGVFDGGGAHRAGDIISPPPGLVERGWATVVARTAGGPVEVRATAARMPDGVLLIIARDDAGQRDFEGRIGSGLLIAFAIVLAASLAVGLLLNALVIQRADEVAGVAERIAAGDLRARAQVSERGDSFDRIGASLNRMLDRIEELLIGLRMITDSLAHDLRTPLTRMRGAAESALAPGGSDAGCRTALEQVNGELERVLAVFTALIDIARAESGLSREMMRPVRLDEVAVDVAGLFAPVIEDAGQTFETKATAPVTLWAHEELLRLSIGNLLFNAARYAGAGARVSLEVVSRPDGAAIIVADDGPGVPAEQRERVKERFVRLDEARGGSGSGLGLSIVAAAAKLHGGELLLEDNRPGLRAVLVLRRPG